MATKTLQRFIPWKSFNELFVSIVYFVQGSAGLTGIAMMIILREQLELDFLQMGMISAASILPWSIKPIFGILTDLVPIGKFRRRPYLHIGPLIAFIGYLLIAFYGHSFESFIIPLIFANLGLSLTDVATDGFVVEESDENNAARIQGITQASIRVASFMTSFFSGLLIYSELVSPHSMYLILAFFPLITFAASFYVKEKPVSELSLFEPAPENSISTESSLEHYQTKKIDNRIFTPAYISSLIIIFALLISNMVFSMQITEWLQTNMPALSPSYITVAIWLSFGVWMLSYFDKLKKLKLTSGMIYLAILFILLWRINPGTGNTLFFYVKDTLLINEKTLGFVGTVSQIGSIVGVILAVKYFDKIPLKKLLLATVVIAAVFSFSGFAITHPEWGEMIGSAPILSWIAMIIAAPVYILEACFNSLITGADWVSPFIAIAELSGMEKFLFLQGISEELIFMIAYIPLLKFAVLITPKKAEATNFAIIASIMNIGLALSAWLSGVLYNQFMIWWRPELEVTAIDVDMINLLIWINILTTLTCLIVLPFLKTKEFAKITKE
jgi:MFS family permease